MVGDGKTGESAAGDDKSGPESEPSAPSSRGRRALLAAGTGERSHGLQNVAQPSGNAARLALERELFRVQPVSRHDRSKRKKARRSGQSVTAKAATPTETGLAVQLEPTAGRPGTVAKARRAKRLQQSESEASSPMSRRGASGSASLEEADWAARWQEPAEGDDIPADAASDVTFGDAVPQSDAGEAAATGETPSDGKRARGRKRRSQRKPSPNSVAKRLLLPVVAAEWDGEVAAFTERGMTPPPLPYRPADFREAFKLTAEQRRAIPKDQIRHLNAKATQCVDRALGVCDLLEAWRPRMASLPVKLALIDHIPTLARALSHADVEVAWAFDVTYPDFISPSETMVLTRRELLQRLLRFSLVGRARLISEIRNLITLERVPTGALSNLKGGKGYSNVAHDVLALIELRRAAVASGAHSNISEEDIQRCNLAAHGLMETSARTPNGIDAERARALEERSRAFTLLWLAYSEAERAFAFIFWHHGKQRVVLPSLV